MKNALCVFAAILFFLVLKIMKGQTLKNGCDRALQL